MNDLKYTMRQLLKTPGFTATVVVTLALCIGANTTLLSALYGLVMKPLPVDDPERLVQLFNLSEGHMAHNTYSQSSWNQYRDFKQRKERFADCALRTGAKRIVQHDGVTQRIRGQAVTVFEGTLLA